MKCSRCSAELPASATYCFECGQGVQNTSESVPFHHSTTTFSYLPAGAPPWPTTVLTLQKTNNVSVTSTSSNEVKTDPKPKRSVSSVLIMTALLLLVPILGAAVTFGTLFARGQLGNSATTTASSKAVVTTVQQPTPQATAASNQLPTPSSSKKFSDNDLNILLEYPDNWDTDQIHKTTSNTLLDIRPHQQLSMIFYVNHLSNTFSTQFSSVDEVNTAQLQGWSQQQGITTLQPVASTNTNPPLAGTTWSQQEATFTVSNGNKYHLTAISTQRNKSYYSILFLVPDAYYDEAMSKYIQPMLMSIQFIK